MAIHAAIAAYENRPTVIVTAMPTWSRTNPMTAIIRSRAVCHGMNSSSGPRSSNQTVALLSANVREG
jgi:hypothetical protein